ncbi:FtsX-like permease family protein [Lactobacillus sp. YT155]|uniref:FtsX-like permease family protein n=1 Tax=Lactobacillus sp. YT155 TaxID=3060955 RepID=UPI00266019BF|nr:FtsX-like permease family protein [Lactobacillus sp. YT155]MDO1605805.1 FtsX-like permease family protein [Lactobacillus sp. YT155]
MLNKLAISGIKHRIRDYAVLFSGLVISSAVFYMFMTLATNQSFLKTSTPVDATPIIFGFGIILLAIITLVYLVYANGFLMSMRQKEYGMFMMLGARGSKIGRMIFLETVIIGMISTVVGIVLGIGLTGALSQWLIDSMDLTIKSFNPIYLPAIGFTFIFFIVIFALAAIRNSLRLRKTNVLKLLHMDQQPVRIKKAGFGKLILAIIGVGLLAAGYYSMILLGKGAMILLPVALITIVLGTYLVINSLFSWIIRLLKSNRRFSLKKLNNFTLSQLGFRISDYTRILSMVAMLFALALGAITVGGQLKSVSDFVVGSNNYYDAVVHNIDDQQRANIKKIDVKDQVTYNYKIKGNQLYFNLEQFKNHKFANYKMVDYTKQDEMKTPPVEYYGFSNKKQQSKAPMTDLFTQVSPSDASYVPNFVNTSEYQKAGGKERSMTFIKSSGFHQNLAAIKKVAVKDKEKYPTLIDQKYQNYMMINSFFSGLEFMGIFLGIAFLAMLASCLMFKILSGAASDIKRYEMLHKMGTRNNLLRTSVNKEIATLFLIPGVMGIVHVLFGLQMFRVFVIHPYANILLPFSIFFCLYIVYYFVTVTLYKQIVLKKIK